MTYNRERYLKYKASIIKAVAKYKAANKDKVKAWQATSRQRKASREVQQ